MAFDPEAKLFDVLAGGYHLTAELQALLLRRPLDSRGQEEAMAFSQELTRVFLVSMSMLKPDESNKVAIPKMAPEARTGHRFGVCTPAKDKRINREGVTSHKNIREEELITRKEITSSPHSEDGYLWRKYGQKNIQNYSFARCYYKCKRDRHCAAKKKVQQQNGSSSDVAPMFEVTYVNHHTCHDANNNEGSSKSSLPTTTTTTTGQSPHSAGSSAEENEAIVSCLATVISGGPAPAYEPQQVMPSAYEYGGSVADWEMMIVDGDTAGFSWDASSSSFCPAEAAEVMMDVCRDARFADTVWPQYHT